MTVKTLVRAPQLTFSLNENGSEPIHLDTCDRIIYDISTCHFSFTRRKQTVFVETEGVWSESVRCPKNASPAEIAADFVAKRGFEISTARDDIPGKLWWRVRLSLAS
jgi:hypothetical protein